MPLFHKKPVERSCFIYHDESGVVGTRGVFIVGLLFVKDRKPLYQKITEIRQRLRFKEEIHFSDVSNPKVCKVCCEVLDAVLKEPIWFRGYVFDNSKIDLSYFGTHKKKPDTRHIIFSQKKHSGYLPRTKRMLLYIAIRKPEPLKTTLFSMLKIV